MKPILFTLMLAGALAQFNPAAAQEEPQDRDRLQQERRAAEAAARQQAEAVKAQIEAAKAQAEAVKSQAEAGRRQAEAGVKEQAARAQQQAGEQIRKAMEVARDAAQKAMAKADVARVQSDVERAQQSDEVAKAIEKAQKAAQKALEKADLPAGVEAEIQRAMRDAEAAVARSLYAQAASPKPAAAPAAPAAPALPGVAAAPPVPPAKPVGPGKRPTWGTFGTFGGTHRPGVRPLVVSSKAMDAATMATIEEDLNVMWRILDKETEKELGKDNADRAMGIFISSPNSRGPNAVLMDGYGALFTLSVRFPLLAPPKEKEEKKAEATPDTQWEKTKRELYGAPESEKNKFFGLSHGESRLEVAYDAGKVEALKTALLEALKNASNIRQVKPDEFISVAVLGGGSSWGDTFVYKGGGGSTMTSYSVSTAGVATTVTSDPSGKEAREVVLDKADGGGSTLTIRVKKSDADAFAKGKLTLEEFRQKAAINIY